MASTESNEGVRFFGFALVFALVLIGFCQPRVTILTDVMAPHTGQSSQLFLDANYGNAHGVPNGASRRLVENLDSILEL